MAAGVAERLTPHLRLEAGRTVVLVVAERILFIPAELETLPPPLHLKEITGAMQLLIMMVVEAAVLRQLVQMATGLTEEMVAQGRHQP